MMFIVRSTGERPAVPGIEVKLSRATPAIVPEASGQDRFLLRRRSGRDRGAACFRLERRRTARRLLRGRPGGGVGIWGQGRYWEIRDTPFTVKEAVGPSAPTDAGPATGEQVNVRGAIFGV